VCEVAGSPPYTDVVGAYDQKLLSEEVIDRALRRLYEGLVRAGYFDPASASPYRDIGWSDVNTAEAQALALQSASDGLVLLKNDGTLPIKLEGKTVALIGHWASGTRSMLGGYSGIPPYYHSPVYAAGQLNLTYKYASGPVAPASTARDTWTADALSAANKSDVILYFGGLDQSVASEDKDRDSIAWPPAQLTLIQTLAGLGKPLVVIQLGDQVDDTPLLTNPNVSAILWAGYPGQSGGTAVLNAITGVSPPAGRLPVTQYPSSYTSQLPLTDMSLRPDPASGRPGRTYRWLPRNATVLPFGYGLHYTNFTARLILPLKPLAPPGPPHPPSTSSSSSSASSSSSTATASPSSSPPQPRNIVNTTSTPPTPSPSPSPTPGPNPAQNFTLTPSALLAPCKLAHRDLCPLPYPVTVEVTNTGARTSDYVGLVFATTRDAGPPPHPLKTLVAYARLRGIAPGRTARAQVQVALGDLARVDAAGNRVLYPGRYGFVLGVGEDGEGEGEGGVVEMVVSGEEVVLDEFPQPRGE
jgi:hypothetical protein